MFNLSTIKNSKNSKLDTQLKNLNPKVIHGIDGSKKVSKSGSNQEHELEEIELEKAEK